MEIRYIIYDIPSFGVFDKVAGPYALEEIRYHVNDISTFVGVENVRVLSAERYEAFSKEEK